MEENESQFEIHITIKKRTGRTYLTSVTGLDKLEKPDGITIDTFMKKLLSVLKKKLICGAFIEENEKGYILTFNGDHREEIKKFLLEKKLVTENQIKLHGF